MLNLNITVKILFLKMYIDKKSYDQLKFYRKKTVLYNRVNKILKKNFFSF